MIKVIVSSCLLGAPVRPNGGDKRVEHPILRRWLDEGRVVALCPEMLGGLGTPRLPSEIVVRDETRRVVANNGDDVTRAFDEGARIVAEEASRENAAIALLKEGSPSCGTHVVYDGTFSGNRVAGEGVTAARLRAAGMAVFSEEELEAADAWIARKEAGVIG